MEHIIPLKFAGRIGLVPVCIGDGGDHYTVIGRSRVGQFFLALQATAVCAVNWAARALGLKWRLELELKLTHHLVPGSHATVSSLDETNPGEWGQK